MERTGSSVCEAGQKCTTKEVRAAWPCCLWVAAFCLRSSVPGATPNVPPTRYRRSYSGATTSCCQSSTIAGRCTNICAG
ncbi:hypothetical protein JG688_00018385 [Phytophthora aleatoria]|uniref:Uncharacterized protein n=1 Tax=Phytophthora aleatoria TaxID=2496075 RepID=A0A8J5M0N4_9STRA|nr:hypothetical protein JG688_00018385 [Phytophthora aleatoria]